MASPRTDDIMLPPNTSVDGDQRTIGALVHDLSQEIPELVRSEIRLAQAELTEKGKRAGIGIGAFSAAGLVTLYGLAALLAAAVLALALVLPGWAAALIVGAVLLLIAGGLALFGRRKVTSATPLKPERALSGVQEDVATVKGANR